MNARSRVSLLYPAQSSPRPSRAEALHSGDLGLVSITRALDFDQRHTRIITATLTALETDPTIIQYRQDVLRDLVANPDLAARLIALLPTLTALAEAGPSARWNEQAALPLVGARLADLDSYVTCVEQLWHALVECKHPLQAQAWRDLQAMVASMRADDDYTRLRVELPLLQAQLAQAGSVTLGINLDGQLQPESATLLAISPNRYAGKGGVIERLLGEHRATDSIRGVTALYKASEGQQRSPEHELFRDLGRLVERVAAPVGAALERYVRVNAAPLTTLAGELAFYLGALRLWRQLEAAGLPVCLPEITPANERAGELRATYSIDLALRKTGNSEIIPNDSFFTPETPIMLVMGPNSGGKTTYARAIAQAQVMFQAGLFVAAEYARLSPVEAVLSHFATVERPGGSGGRLAEELERVAQLFKHSTATCLLIFNEPFSSTDPHSARLIARDVFAGLRFIRARTIYITHLHDLAADLVPTGDEADGVVCVAAQSVVTEGNDGTPTYRIERGRPNVSAHALALAHQFGLDRVQLEAQLRAQEEKTA